MSDPLSRPQESNGPAMPTAAPYRWFRAANEARRRPRRTLVRVLLALTTSTALGSVAFVIGAAAIVPPIGARRMALEQVAREFTALLEPGERVLATTLASQQRWTDIWRESHGMLVATNLRLLYVAAPPSPLLRPRDDGPRELLRDSYAFATPLSVQPRERLRGLDRALVLTVGPTQVVFGVADADWIAALELTHAIDQARHAAITPTDSLSHPTGSGSWSKPPVR